MLLFRAFLFFCSKVLPFSHFCLILQQFGPILDVEIIFNERGSKVSTFAIHCTLMN